MTIALTAQEFAWISPFLRTRRNAPVLRARIGRDWADVVIVAGPTVAFGQWKQQRDARRLEAK